MNFNKMIKKLIEVNLIRLAAFLLDRNVERSMLVSRKDNNRIFEIVGQLKAISKRMNEDYENEPVNKQCICDIFTNGIICDCNRPLTPSQSKK